MHWGAVQTPPLSTSEIKECSGIQGNNDFTGNFEKPHMEYFPTKGKNSLPMVTRVTSQILLAGWAELSCSLSPNLWPGVSHRTGKSFISLQEGAAYKIVCRNFIFLFHLTPLGWDELCSVKDHSRWKGSTGRFTQGCSCDPGEQQTALNISHSWLSLGSGGCKRILGGF